MEETSGPLTLASHEAASQARYESLHNVLNSMKPAAKEMAMSEKEVNVNLGDAGGANAMLAAALAGGNRGYGGDGFGLGGGGIVGGLVLGALLGNNNGGLFGNRNGAVVADPGIPAGNVSLATLQGIGDIKGAVPQAACETMNAICDAESSINNQMLAQTIGLNQNINDAKAAGVAAANANALANAAGFAGVKDATDALSTQTAIGFGNVNTLIERTGWQLSQAITNDGDKTRALIQSIDKTNDSRLITQQANEIVELRNQALAAENRRGIEIQISNNQSQNQLQFQAQQQVLAQLANCLAETSQLARATNQQLIIGNAGPVTGGAQTANPTNVRA